MRLLGFYWGIAGVIIFLLYAVLRLSQHVLEMTEYNLNFFHWLLLIVFAVWMAWAEGYKGFHLAFSPRVIARARYLRYQSHPLLSLLAPLFCMGYIYATKKRKMVSYILTGTIIMMVMLLRITPQPWRGIIDVGVVAGLTLGILSLVYFWIQVETGKWDHPILLDLPGQGKKAEAINQAEQP